MSPRRLQGRHLELAATSAGRQAVRLCSNLATHVRAFAWIARGSPVPQGWLMTWTVPDPVTRVCLTCAYIKANDRSARPAVAAGCGCGCGCDRRRRTSQERTKFTNLGRKEISNMADKVWRTRKPSLPPRKRNQPEVRVRVRIRVRALARKTKLYACRRFGWARHKYNWEPQGLD